MVEPVDDAQGLYRRARVIAGVLCFVVVAVLMVFDAIGVAANRVDSVQLGLLLGTGMLLLGVEAGRRLLGGGG